MITSFRCKYGCLSFGHSFTTVLSLYLYKRTLQIENIYASLSDMMINSVCVCLCLVSITNSRRVTKEFRTFLFFRSIRRRDYFLFKNFYLFSLLLPALSTR